MHLLAEVREHGNDAERAPVDHALDPATPGCVSSLELRRDHRQVMLASDTVHAHEDLERPFALELVEDQLNQAGPFG